MSLKTRCLSWRRPEQRPLCGQTPVPRTRRPVAVAVSSAHQAARAEEVAQAPPHPRIWAAAAVAVAAVGVDLPEEGQAG